MKKQIKNILNKLPCVAGLRAQIFEEGTFPAGHYYSPIPSRNDVARKLGQGGAVSDLNDVDLRRDEQLKLLRTFSRYYGELPFEDKPNQRCRYHFENPWFSYTDAIILYSFLRHFDPKRIVEIGSGYSSAVMVDTLDNFPNRNLAVSFIEPYPDRLNALIDIDSMARATLLEKKVQDVELKLFRSLESNDLLFVDSSHVMKFGSDLYTILFEILPILAVGTHVHFHDIFYPFEYPDEWLREGRYWNECYLLRAFLACNKCWEITLFNHYVNLEFQSFIETNMPLCRKNFGGGLYITRIA